MRHCIGKEQIVVSTRALIHVKDQPSGRAPSDDRFCQLPLTLCRWKKRTKSRSPSIKITTGRNLAFCTKHVYKSLWKGKRSVFAKERNVGDGGDWNTFTKNKQKIDHGK